MSDNQFQGYFARKILQINNSTNSTFDTSQPSFIALLSVIGILTVALVIIIILVCYRYNSHREKKVKNRYKNHKIFEDILPSENNQQAVLPISTTPTYASSYSGRSSEQLCPTNQISSVHDVPSRRSQQSMIDAYLNDLNKFQPASIDVKKLNSYLFIDLHSTSSETFPENTPKQFSNNTMTSGYQTSTGEESRMKRRLNLIQQRKRSHGPRFLMRERNLTNPTQKLPQLRQKMNLFVNDNTNTSSTTNVNQDLSSTNISMTTDDYDDSHAYHVNQNEIIRALKDNKNLPIFSIDSPQFYSEQDRCYYEMVSTSRGDDSDFEKGTKAYPFVQNDSTIV